MSSTLDAQYECLAELKEIDDRVNLIERDCAKIPAEIKVYDDAITAKRSSLDAARALYAETEKKLRAAERDLKEKEDALFKAEGKMMEVKTNIEYAAATKENQNQKTAKAGLEDKVLQLINGLEEQKKLLTAVETEFKSQEQVILVDKNKLVAEQVELTKTLEKLLGQRETTSAKLDPNVSALYKKNVAAKKGVAIANAEGGRCLGCNIQVRAQLYNEILGRKAVHRCSNCGKILMARARVLEAAQLTADVAAK